MLDFIKAHRLPLALGAAGVVALVVGWHITGIALAAAGVVVYMLSGQEG